MYGLLIEHTTLPGKRNTVREIWERLMQPAIAENQGHLAYAYSFRQDENAIMAFQIYASETEAQAFLTHPSYLEYVEASRPFLAGAPKVTVLDVIWRK